MTFLFILGWLIPVVLYVYSQNMEHKEYKNSFLKLLYDMPYWLFFTLIGVGVVSFIAMLISILWGSFQWVIGA